MRKHDLDGIGPDPRDTAPYIYDEDGPWHRSSTGGGGGGGGMGLVLNEDGSRPVRGANQPDRADQPMGIDAVLADQEATHLLKQFVPRLMGILFAPPAASVAQKEIIPRLGDWDASS